MLFINWSIKPLLSLFNISETVIWCLFLASVVLWQNKSIIGWDQPARRIFICWILHLLPLNYHLEIIFPQDWTQDSTKTTYSHVHSIFYIIMGCNYASGPFVHCYISTRSLSWSDDGNPYFVFHQLPLISKMYLNKHIVSWVQSKINRWGANVQYFTGLLILTYLFIFCNSDSHFFPQLHIGLQKNGNQHFYHWHHCTPQTYFAFEMYFLRVAPGHGGLICTCACFATASKIQQEPCAFDPDCLCI